MADLTTVRTFFFLHMRPNRVPAVTLRYTHTFGLGGMSALLATLLIVTGALLMLGYEPVPERAYASIVGLQQETLFGPLLRGIHFWSANLLIATVLLHLLRVVFSGASEGPRRFNWVVGLGLLLGVLAANFTGYLLPWDQLSYWAVTICTGMMGYVPGIGAWLQNAVRGGQDVGASTLIIFYTLHTTMVPVFLVVAMGYHFWRVRKARGVVRPLGLGEPPPPETVYGRGWPDLIVREAAVGAVLVAVVVALAVFFTPALGDPANPGMSPNPAKAPWYFAGFQELQIHFHPVFAVLIMPLAAAVGLVLWPYRRRQAVGHGVWFGSAAGRRTALFAVAAALVATPLAVVADEKWRGTGDWLPGVPPVIGGGLLPLLLLAVLVAGFRWITTKFMKATGQDADQAVFVLLGTSFLVLTVTAVWFRGAGMALVWPW